jgi:acyl-CoA synthetase (AMP-forming)/AMP-acid ligase II
MYPRPIIDVVLERLREAPQREALTDRLGVVPRGELFAASGRLAFELLRSGVRSGDRLLLGLPPDRRFVVALLAALRLGAVVVPVHPKAKLREVKHLLWDAGPRVAFADEPLSAVVRDCGAAVRLLDAEALAGERRLVAEEPPDEIFDEEGAGDGGHGDDDDDEPIELLREHAGAAVASDAPALILYTSGTTGLPKGAVHTHGSLGTIVESLRSAWRLSAEDRLLHCLPLHHLHGLVVGLLGSLASGGACELEPDFEASRALARLAQSRATLFFGVPAMYAKLLEVAEVPPLPELRLFVSGSAPLPPAQKRAFEQRFGRTILERYGATEIGIALSQALDGARPAGSVGVPLPGVETRIARPGGEGDDPGGAAEGELLVRGPTLFRGYFEDEEATARALVDGWYRTGDLVRRDAGGSFTILGRLTTDLIKVKGHRVGALEVEAALAEHPQVAEVAVVGAPDAESGEAVVAFVRARDATLTAAQLTEHARALLAPHQVPRRIELVDELPRTGPGKVDKRSLQARARGG